MICLEVPSCLCSTGGGEGCDIRTKLSLNARFVPILYNEESDAIRYSYNKYLVRTYMYYR